MKKGPFPFLLWVAFAGLAMAGGIRAADLDEQEAESEPTEEDSSSLPSISDMELPSFQRLMQGPPFDWLVLPTKKVIVIEPVPVRPGTLQEIDRKIQGMMRKAGDPPESEQTKQRRMALYYLPVTLTEGDFREYKLHIKFVKEIVYYEDLMLRRIDALLDERKIRQAYELLTALEQRQPAWSGLVPRKHRLMFTEAAVKLDEGEAQHALALLEALHDISPRHPGLETQFGTVLDRLAATAIEQGEPRAARYFLRRVARRYPNHAQIKDWTARLMKLTRDELEKAAAAERAGQLESALDLAEEAARTWPELPEVLPAYNRLANRRQRLRVGVVDLPDSGDEASGVLLASAERRKRQLTQTPLFEPARFDNKVIRYQTRFFSEWEPTELGHSVLFRLRSYRQSGESQPLVTGANLANQLGRRLNARGAAFDARFAAAVESIEVRSPFELMLRFRQVPLRPESLFAFATGGGAGPSGFAGLSDEASAPQSSSAATYPFELSTADRAQARYVRTIPEPDASANRHVAEIIEVAYETYDKAIQGLLRGEVSMLPRVPAWSVSSLSSRPEFFAQRYALPTTHVLQFNPQTQALSARTLRRALVYALNRPQILRDVFLHDLPGRSGRLTSAPVATTSYAYNRFDKVEPHKFDPALAFSLAKSAEKELGGKWPSLRLACSPEPDIQSAARKIVEQWAAIGIEASIVPTSTASLSDANPGDWDMIYRTDILAEPLVDLWQYLSLATSTETGALAHLPAWLRQELLELDRAGDWETAERLLHRLHKQFWAEVHLIPLWELDDVLVYRKNIRGVPESPVTTYQSIERWKVEPWFSREPPS